MRTAFKPVDKMTVSLHSGESEILSYVLEVVVGEFRVCWEAVACSFGRSGGRRWLEQRINSNRNGSILTL